MVIDIALPDGTALVVRHMDQIAVSVSPLHVHDFIIKDPEVTLEEPCRAPFVYFYFWFYLWNFHQFEVYWKGNRDARPGHFLGERWGAIFPSLLAYAVDLSKDSQAGEPSRLFGLAFLRLLALIGAQLLRPVANG